MQTTRTPYSISFMATVLLLLLFACHSTVANAAVALGATRVIYPANQKQVLLPVTNTDPASVYPRNFTWNIISNNNVVMPTGGCTVDSRNVTVDLPDFPGSAEIPLGVYCSSEQKLSFYLSGATTDSSRQVFANTAPDATKASGVGVSLMRNGKILATGENVSLGTVNKSKVPLGLSATYGQTGNKVSAGTVQSVIGVTFIYE